MVEGSALIEAVTMAAVFEAGGIRFLYPENWLLERSQSEEGWSVSINSPNTAFMVISVYKDRPPVKEVLASTLAAMRDDYPDLEADEVVEKIAERRAVGHDLHFFSMDLTNTCWTRSFRAPRSTILIVRQTNDLELDAVEEVMRAIQTSLQVIED